MTFSTNPSTPVRWSSDREPMLPIRIVDAFAAGPFQGNPAAVTLLEDGRTAEWMQQVAAEMNLSETAFLARRDGGFDLRWFTPGGEVGLCGHATLASAHAVWEAGWAPAGELLRFHTRSGELLARPRGQEIEIDLPAQPAQEVEPVNDLVEALDGAGTWFGRTQDRGGGDVDYLMELPSEQAVRELQPRFDILKQVVGGVIVTAVSDSERFDYVCRYFAPWWGIDEDPVTGAAHCALAPHWNRRLGRDRLVGFQASARGGVVRTHLEGDRVLLAGAAVTVLRGQLLV